MGTLHYLQYHRVKRMLAKHAVRLLVGEIWLNVGRDLRPPMHVEMNDEALTATFSFGGQLKRIAIPWATVLRSEPLYPPPRPGSPAPALAMAA